MKKSSIFCLKIRHNFENLKQMSDISLDNPVIMTASNNGGILRKIEELSSAVHQFLKQFREKSNKVLIPAKVLSRISHLIDYIFKSNFNIGQNSPYFKNFIITFNNFFKKNFRVYLNYVSLLILQLF